MHFLHTINERCTTNSSRLRPVKVPLNQILYLFLLLLLFFFPPRARVWVHLCLDQSSILMSELVRRQLVVRLSVVEGLGVAVFLLRDSIVMTLVGVT